MFEVLNKIALAIENFMTTPVATAIGVGFLVVFSVLILYLIKYFEQN